MKHTTLLLTLLMMALAAKSQTGYWVFFTDKNETTFDPYSYFDPKAIERYRQNHADLYDITNYPLNDSYVQQVNTIVASQPQQGLTATEIFGHSRWLNAVAVTATADQIDRIRQLPFVREVAMLDGEMVTADNVQPFAAAMPTQQGDAVLTEQLLRMQGQHFVDKGIDGKGIRIAVFDGGFHGVNTHRAFQHLRDNNQIVATWNFTNKQEDVYDNHTHGTMVLSCIAGKMGDRMLGLATGATFLLAKTEVDPEPYKEEVWWAQAMEWADKNGADIINSSLGYTQDRHYTWEMDGRSRVSKAANIAARKGILVCNSAGNSGDDPNWKIIGCPADADSILSVGGINPSLSVYSHIVFSSYGPTADGRMKPNVCNYGYAECADAYNDTATKFAAGTSFSSPLTAGFCACAMQTVRDKRLTAMQMKERIERAADLYPYYDYALGYGVPQATFFTENGNGKAEESQPGFELKERGEYILIHPLKDANSQWRQALEGLPDDDVREDAVLFKFENANGTIERYFNIGITNFNDSMAIAIHKSFIGNKTLVACVDGYTLKYKMSKLEQTHYAEENDEKGPYFMIDYETGRIQQDFIERGDRSLVDNQVSDWGIGKKYTAEAFFQYGMQWFFPYNTMRYSDGANLGGRIIRNFTKWYGLGLGLEIAGKQFNYDPAAANPWDNILAINDFTNVEKKHLIFSDINIELFQRIRIIKKGNNKKGLHWDLGVYGGLHLNDYIIRYNENQNPGASSSQTNTYTDLRPLNNWNLGLTTRMAWNQWGLYVRYRLSQPGLDLPRLELGLQITF